MIFSIQYMRAIAAIMVVTHHASRKGFTYSTDPLDWFNIGRAGVDLFFIISGYIMCHTVNTKKINLTCFMLARIKRILPLYWFLTTAALIIFFYFPDKINSSGGNTDILNSFTLFPTQGKYLVQNGWTLSYEFLFYALFSVCLFFTNKYRYLIPCVLIALLVTFGNFNNDVSPLFYLLSNPLLLEFIFGICVFYWRELITQKPSLSIILIPLSIIALIYINNNGIIFSRVISYGMPALLFFVGMLSLESFFNKSSHTRFFRLAKTLGDSSYSLYLVHPFILVIGAIVLSQLGINATGSMFVILLILGSIIGGHCCFLLIEKNLAKLVNRKKISAQ